MECKEFEKMIPNFLSGKLNFILLKQFDEHRKQCSCCQEELEIQFLVAEGIQHLEEGDAFDLQKELEYQLKDAQKKVHINMRFLKIGVILECLAGIAILSVIVWILLGAPAIF